MPDVLADPPSAVYVLLAVAALGAGFVWFRVRKRPAAIVALALFGLLALVVAADAAFESPLEEADRRLRLMSDAAARKNWAGAFEHVSDQFKYDGRLGKKDIQAAVAKAAGAHNASVRFKPIERDTVEHLPDGGIKVGFVAQADSPQFPNARYVVYVEAVFAKDPDGVLRMRSAKTFKFLERKTPETVPGL